MAADVNSMPIVAGTGGLLRRDICKEAFKGASIIIAQQKRGMRHRKEFDDELDVFE